MDDDESDIQEDEPHTYREERRLAFPNEPAPGERRTSFAEAIDEFLHHLPAIAEDHKAHHEAMTLLDEEQMTTDGSDVASEAGDSAWSETGSEMADSVSEAGGVQTEVDSGLATSLPPLVHGKVEDRGQDEGRVSATVSGGSRKEIDTEAQNDIVGEESPHASVAGQSVKQELNVEGDKTDKLFQRNGDHSERQAEKNAAPRSKPSITINDATDVNRNQAGSDTNQAVTSPTPAPSNDRATFDTGDDKPAEAHGSPNRPGSSENVHTGSEDERDTSPVSTDTAPVAAVNLPSEETHTADPQPPVADSSPTPSHDSSRESSAADSRRGSAILRSLLRASLPAEVLGSHSDTDTLQERRASLATGMAGGLMPPTVDLQARSPGQSGSLEMMATSPGELSKQSSPAESGDASEAVSESELPHHQPVRSLASIADQLLRGDSEEETPRVVPSGIGKANSMAAISDQLLTDHSPGEPTGPAEMTAIDEA